MSFKDKPLKKIVADTRITIDAIHNDIINEFSRSIKDKDKKINQLNELLKEENNIQQDAINELKDEIDRISSVEKDEINYYLDTSSLLTEYYSKKDGCYKTQNREISVLDFMNKGKKKNDENLINQYMVQIDDTVIPEKTSINIDLCPLCNEVLGLKTVESVLLCSKCGYTEKIIINSEKVSYKDPPGES